MTNKKLTVIYIHGFNSSPLSHKSTQLRQWLKKWHPEIHIHIPALPIEPLEAIAQIEAIVKNTTGNIGLIGSSLGGFYAAFLAEKFDAPAVLINPAVRPFNTLSQHLGENKNYYDNKIDTLEQQHVDDLRMLFTEKHNNPQRLLLMVQTADQTLDYREATTHYWRIPAIIEYGGNHSFQNAARFFPTMLQFLQNNT
jgi:predicted esterase YcpF (UPF0227 family)